MLHLFVFSSVVCGLSSPSFERIQIEVTYEKVIECEATLDNALFEKRILINLMYFRDIRPVRLELKDSKYNKLCNGFHGNLNAKSKYSGYFSTE